MKLYEKLNLYKVQVDPGKNAKLESVPSDDSLFDEDGCVVDEDFKKFLDELGECVLYFDFHPVDDRAGYVAFAERGEEEAWYDESECCWAEG